MLNVEPALVPADAHDRVAADYLGLATQRILEVLASPFGRATIDLLDLRLLFADHDRGDASTSAVNQIEPDKPRARFERRHEVLLGLSGYRVRPIVPLTRHLVGANLGVHGFPPSKIGVLSARGGNRLRSWCPPPLQLLANAAEAHQGQLAPRT